MDEKHEQPVPAEVVDPTPDTAHRTPAEASFPPGMPPPPTMFGAGREQSPVTRREIVAILLMVVLCDLTVYRAAGFAGYALLFAVAPALLLLGSQRPRLGWRLGLVGLMTLVLAVKMVWLGSGLLVAAGFTLLVAFSMALSGFCPYMIETAVFASQTILSGYEGLAHYWRSSSKVNGRITGGGYLAVALPLAALLTFSSIFVLANPNLLRWLGENVQPFLQTLRDQVFEYLPEAWEMLFWAVVAWVTIGLLRPVMRLPANGGAGKVSGGEPPQTGESATAPLYAAFRNTLVALIVLFAVYLVFEFATLWRDEFPKGFYYAGYAHEGAAWLTLALALATAVLSLIFRGRLLGDARLKRVRRLAWLWSAENMILALAVYNRLYIYVNFNGMTWMRTVGLFGMTAVVIGFLLVLWKIAFNRDFLWLVRRHLWTLALVIYLFALTPVDAIWVQYNVRQILSGDLAPSVQLSVHPISSEGLLLLQPLLGCEDEKIREGIRAMLAQRHDEAEAAARGNQSAGWTTYQLADQVALDGLRRNQAGWKQYRDRPSRRPVLEAFHEYVYQWY